jgi:AhpD family alkylhydroperoxidase
MKSDVVRTNTNRLTKGARMEARLDFKKISPDVHKAMLGLEKTVNASRLEASLLDLVRLRASQINGCAQCIDMHSKDLRAQGENEERLDLLNAWREAPFYTERERVALAWTEAVTLIADGHAPDEVYEEVRKHFTDAELVNLTLAIVAINGWNRLNVAFRTVPGTYRAAYRRASVLYE